MQIRKHRAQFRKVIGLHAKPMLFRCFDRKLTKARDRAGNRVRGSLLLDLFERDPPNSVRAHRTFYCGSAAVKLARKIGAELRSTTSCVCGCSEHPRWN